MIKIINKAFQVGGTAYVTIEEAQKAELYELLGQNPMRDEDTAAWIITNKAAILDILTTTANSRPKTRKIHGGTRSRKSESVPASEAVNGTATNNQA